MKTSESLKGHWINGAKKQKKNETTKPNLNTDNATSAQNSSQAWAAKARSDSLCW